MAKMKAGKHSGDGSLAGDWPSGAYDAFLRACPKIQAEEKAGAEIRAALDTGRRVRKPFERANDSRRSRSANEVAAWQHTALTLWAKPLHEKKSASDIARLIDPLRWNTIRRHLHKPEK